LSWIGYGEAVSGRYVGATRWEDGEIVEYLADPAVNKSMPDQVAVAANGIKSTPKFAETAPYFVVTRPWFKEGIANPGTCKFVINSDPLRAGNRVQSRPL
jgi:hypothetical protein